MFPSPFTVMDTLVKGFTRGNYGLALLYSFKRLLIGYLIALVLGITLGIIISSNKNIDQSLGGLILSLQSVPSVVWLPLALLWFKMGETSIIFVVVIGGLWNMILSTISGIKNVDPILVKCGKNLGYRGMKLFIKVILPASIPHIIMGMRMAWAFSWRALMAAELIATGHGLGQILMWGRDMGNMNTVLAIMIIIAGVGFITDSLIFKKIELSILERWGLNN